jgi:putative peptidoglycan lipid II flippase
MERIFKIFGKEYNSINQAAFLLGTFAFLSQILGLFRDRSIAHFIGPSPELDAYYAAFRVPDIIFVSIASLASITVLIPFIVSRMEGGKITPSARKFLDDTFTVFFTVMIFVSAIVFILLPYLLFFIAPGFTPELQAKTILLSRIMLLSPILLGLSNLFGSITQLYRKFLIFSLSPVAYNTGIIIGVIFLYPIFGINGLVYGVVLGAFGHFLIQFFASTSQGYLARLTININFTDIKKLVLTSLPRTLGLAFNNIAEISTTAFASYMIAGSISIFNFSYNLQSAPLSIIGVSYAVAAFPTLARSISEGKREEFKNQLKSAGRAIVFWSLPATFLFIVLRAQIVRVVLGSGYFSWENTRLVAASLAIFSLSILAQGMIALLSRAYYAIGDTRRPLIVNFICSASIIFFAYFFIRLFHDVPFFRFFIESLFKVEGIPGTEVLMLPLAYTTGTIINFICHWYFVRHDFMDGESFITRTFFQSLGASFFISFVTYLGLNFFSPIFGTTTLWGVLLQGLLSGALGLGAGVLTLRLLRNEELAELQKTIRTKFWRTRVIAPSQEGL